MSSTPLAREERHGLLQPVPDALGRDSFGYLPGEGPVLDMDDNFDDFEVLPCPKLKANPQEPAQKFIERMAFELQARVDDLREGGMTSGQVVAFSDLALNMHKFAIRRGPKCLASVGDDAEAEALEDEWMAESSMLQRPIYSTTRRPPMVTRPEVKRHRKEFERYCEEFERWRRCEGERLMFAEQKVELEEIRRKADEGEALPVIADALAGANHAAVLAG